MMVGGYTLHLYCENPICPHKYDPTWHPVEFGSMCETGGAARKEARRAGWRIRRGMPVLCPDCRAAKPPEKPAE